MWTEPTLPVVLSDVGLPSSPQVRHTFLKVLETCTETRVLDLLYSLFIRVLESLAYVVSSQTGHSIDVYTTQSLFFFRSGLPHLASTLQESLPSTLSLSRNPSQTSRVRDVSSYPLFSLYCGSPDPSFDLLQWIDTSKVAQRVRLHRGIPPTRSCL